MAPRDHDPELEKRKAKAFDRILAEALSSGARHEDCPDAETLAAFYERALNPAETSHWRAHFAGCSRCQQALAAMAASDPNPLAEREIARLGELVAAASAPPTAAPRARIANWPRFLDPRTLAPLAAAAAFAVALWLAIHPANVTPPENSATAPAASETIVAGNKPAPPPSIAPAARSAATPVPQAPANVAPSQFGASRPASPPPPAPTTNSQSVTVSQPLPKETSQPAEITAPPPAAQAQSSDEASAREAYSAGSAASGAAQDASAAASGATAEPAPAANPAPEQPRSVTESVVVQSKAARIDAIASSGSLARSQDQFVPAFSAAAKTNSRVVWRFGTGGRISRSTDGGRTWTPQQGPVQTDLLAGSAPSETVCWLVGRGGTILRSTDGATWQQLPSPKQAEQNSQPPDWTFVDAHDAQSAVVGTKDGRRFSTTDAGKTWQAQ
jgi:Photosynthesis system II assembly factor YCF48